MEVLFNSQGFLFSLSETILLISIFCSLIHWCISELRIENGSRLGVGVIVRYVMFFIFILKSIYFDFKGFSIFFVEFLQFLLLSSITLEPRRSRISRLDIFHLQLLAHILVYFLGYGGVWLTKVHSGFKKC